jgi:hypothetical protein
VVQITDRHLTCSTINLRASRSWARTTTRCDRGSPLAGSGRADRPRISADPCANSLSPVHATRLRMWPVLSGGDSDAGWRLADGEAHLPATTHQRGKPRIGRWPVARSFICRRVASVSGRARQPLNFCSVRIR